MSDNKEDIEIIMGIMRSESVYLEATFFKLGVLVAAGSTTFDGVVTEVECRSLFKDVQHRKVSWGCIHIKVFENGLFKGLIDVKKPDIELPESTFNDVIQNLQEEISKLLENV